MCAEFEETIWEPNLYNSSQAAIFFPEDPGKGYSPIYGTWGGYDPDDDSSVFIERKGFCKDAYTLSHDICSAAGRTSLLLWASTICNPTVEFGWPKDWRDTLLVSNTTIVKSSTFIPPTAPGPNHCSIIVNNTIHRCTSDVCIVERNNCTEINSAVDKRCFCKGMDLQNKCNATAIERTELNLWLNKTCEDIPEYPGLPNGWEDGLMLMNTSYQDQSDFSWPSCLEANGCFDVLNRTEQDCSTFLCDLDPRGGNCSATTVGFKASCFCRPVGYETTCKGNCKLSWEREGYLKWLNSTCSSVADWNGLPRNWLTLLRVQDDELLPWNWRIQITPTKALDATEPLPPRECPSTASSLVAFAAVNAAMALLVPVFGRRDVMKKLTRGRCGHRGSRMWLLTGPATVMLHVTSNVIGAYIIKSTPGYSAVQVGQLVLLWCTRPRITWMIIALIPWQAEDAIYFSVASSTLLAEVILQALGAYYMGVATNYARVQKFYQVGRLQQAPRGKDAAVMYAGSIMWLSVMFIAVATCLWSMLGMSNYVAAVAFTIRGFKRKAARSKSLAEARVMKVRSLRTNLDAWSPTGADLEREKQALGNAYTETIRALEALARAWQALQTYVTSDTERLVTASKALRQQRERGPAGNAEEAYFRAYSIWIQLPSKQLVDLGASKGAFAQLNSAVRANRAASTDQINSTSMEITFLKAALVKTQVKVRTLQFLIDEYRKQRQQTPRYAVSENGLVLKHISDLQHQLYNYPNSRKPTQHQELSHLRQIDAALVRGVSLGTQLQNLIGGGQNTGGDQDSVASLEASIRNQETKQRSELRVLQAWNELCTFCAQVGAEHARLTKIWAGLEKKRRKEDEERRKGNGALLKKIALRSIAGMFGCWAAQWVWWVGYVRASGDE
ncbi:hypothetical protein AYO21_01578 [Fonsecaea monophora]|uniref:Uncharacterized protein n=1 Tax=Fonsecaea monophora TaxID=254056 RepID=A0A177FK13_9EURO|nr:hypothetical protein AYO21_01578 [Fonsecaea monophora]OAG44121.1 hypothetical protein AYO21_01578 [Fonsecaea monophora]